MPKAQTATKPKPTASRAGVRPSASRAAPKVAPKPAAAKPVVKVAAPKGIVPKPPAVHKKNGDKGMASKSAAAVKAKVNDKETPEKEKDAAAPETPDSPLPLLDLS